MSDPSSSRAGHGTRDHPPGDYVIEHYGFPPPVATSGPPASPAAARSYRRSGPAGANPAPQRRRMLMAAGALGLVLASGVAGFATTTASGADSRVAGDRGVSVVQDRGGGDPGDSPAHRGPAH